ncbi:MAG: immunoglobulin domain-containing protein [Verrucomicrobiota bacterium]
MFIAFAALVGISVVKSQAEEGSLAANFNANITSSTFSPAVYSLALQEDGKAVIGGQFDHVDGTARNRIARLKSDGSLDTNFNPGSGADDSVASMVVQSDGKVLIGGWLTSINGTPRTRIARLMGTPTAVAPSITTQPQSQTVAIGSGGILNVVASGTGPLRYQWRKEGEAIPGATNASYTLASAALLDAGTFSVIVSNAAGSVTSADAVLRVAEYTFTTIPGPGGIGNDDGTGSAARFYEPQDVTVDSAGNVYVADTGNHTIRKVTPAGVVTTLAGLAGSVGSTDGTGSDARFHRPQGVAVDSTGNVYVADREINTIRKVTRREW